MRKNKRFDRTISPNQIELLAQGRIDSWVSPKIEDFMDREIFVQIWLMADVYVEVLKY